MPESTSPETIPAAEADAKNEKAATENIPALISAPATALTVKHEGAVLEIVHQAQPAAESNPPATQNPPVKLIITPVQTTEAAPVQEAGEPVFPVEEKKEDSQEN
jgi:hypothetical protein